MASNLILIIYNQEFLKSGINLTTFRREAALTAKKLNCPAMKASRRQAVVLDLIRKLAEI